MLLPMTTAEIEAEYGVSRVNVRNWAKRGFLDGLRPGKGYHLGVLPVEQVERIVLLAVFAEDFRRDAAAEHARRLSEVKPDISGMRHITVGNGGAISANVEALIAERRERQRRRLDCMAA